MVKQFVPFAPKVISEKNKSIYDILMKYEIFHIINDELKKLFARNPGIKQFILTQQEIVDAISRKHPQYNSKYYDDKENKIIDANLLEIDIFNKYTGWNVEYQRQGYYHEDVSQYIFTMIEE
jgi:hypothetical protein